MRIDEIVGVKFLRARRRIAAEGDARARSPPELPNTIAWTVTAVPASASSTIDAPIFAGARRFPKMRRRRVRRARAVRADHPESAVPAALRNVAKLAGQAFQRLRIEIDGRGHPFRLHHGAQRCVEPRRRHALDDRGVALDETPAAVPGEPRISGQPDEALETVGVDPDVQDRVEHARHGFCRAGPHGNEERAAIVAEAPAGRTLECCHSFA